MRKAVVFGLLAVLMLGTFACILPMEVYQFQSAWVVDELDGWVYRMAEMPRGVVVGGYDHGADALEMGSYYYDDAGNRIGEARLKGFEVQDFVAIGDDVIVVGMDDQDDSSRVARLNPSGSPQLIWEVTQPAAGYFKALAIGSDVVTVGGDKLMGGTALQQFSLDGGELIREVTVPGYLYQKNLLAVGAETYVITMIGSVPNLQTLHKLDANLEEVWQRQVFSSFFGYSGLAYFEGRVWVLGTEGSYKGKAVQNTLVLKSFDPQTGASRDEWSRVMTDETSAIVPRLNIDEKQGVFYLSFYDVYNGSFHDRFQLVALDAKNAMKELDSYVVDSEQPWIIDVVFSEGGDGVFLLKAWPAVLTGGQPDSTSIEKLQLVAVTP